jgi:hypothetical protein
VHLGLADTDMSAGFDGAKLAPAEVARAALDGLTEGPGSPPAIQVSVGGVGPGDGLVMAPVAAADADPPAWPSTTNGRPPAYAQPPPPAAKPGPSPNNPSTRHDYNAKVP